jgi:hypothetical protein
MKSKNYESIRFLREYFHIPRTKKVSWCLVEEKNEKTGDRDIRLGLQIAGSDLYLDVAARRFYTAGTCGPITRNLYPAIRRSYNHVYWFIAGEQPYLSKEVSKTYIADIYYPAMYNKNLLAEQLF